MLKKWIFMSVACALNHRTVVCEDWRWLTEWRRDRAKTMDAAPWREKRLAERLNVYEVGYHTKQPEKVR